MSVQAVLPVRRGRCPSLGPSLLLCACMHVRGWHCKVVCTHPDISQLDRDPCWQLVRVSQGAHIKEDDTPSLLS
jgi:hypothetical protein